MQTIPLGIRNIQVVDHVMVTRVHRNHLSGICLTLQEQHTLITHRKNRKDYTSHSFLAKTNKTELGDRHPVSKNLTKSTPWERKHYLVFQNVKR